MKKLGTEPAFPPSREMQELAPTCEGYHVGMSKRFYAACAAMQGILASGLKIGWTNPNPYLVSRVSYEFADELLKQEETE